MSPWAQEVFISTSGINGGVLTSSRGWDLLQSFLVRSTRTTKPTHLYFDCYRQGVQLFVQFLENDQLFQREAAQPAETGDREREHELASWRTHRRLTFVTQAARKKQGSKTQHPQLPQSLSLQIWTMTVPPQRAAETQAMLTGLGEIPRIPLFTL